MDKQEILKELTLMRPPSGDSWEGHRLGEYTVRRDEHHPMYNHSDVLYYTTLWQNDVAVYDVERNRSLHAYLLYSAEEYDRWDRYFARAEETAEYVMAAAHPHLPAEWADWLCEYAEEDADVLLSMIRAGNAEHWHKVEWPEVLKKLAERDFLGIAEKAEQWAERWRLLLRAHHWACFESESEELMKSALCELVDVLQIYAERVNENWTQFIDGLRFGKYVLDVDHSHPKWEHPEYIATVYYKKCAVYDVYSGAFGSMLMPVSERENEED